jgi:hypothetical protein
LRFPPPGTEMKLHSYASSVLEYPSQSEVFGSHETLPNNGMKLTARGASDEARQLIPVLSVLTEGREVGSGSKILVLVGVAGRCRRVTSPARRTESPVGLGISTGL